MRGFLQALPFTLEYEGGFVDDPDDPGGRTNRGITQVTHDAFRESNGLPPADVQDITDEEVETIYRERYWLEGDCEDLSWPVSFAHFDACVNHGSSNAAKLIQRAAGVTDDGNIGPITRAAIESVDALTLLDAMLWERLEFYEQITDRREASRKFLRGWMKRVLKLRRAAQEEGV